MGGNDTIIANYYTGWGAAIYGGDGNDNIDATIAQYGPVVYGDDGNDIISMPASSSDTAYGGSGNDIIYGGNYTYGGSGHDHIELQFDYYGSIAFGETGNDYIHAAGSGSYISGGRGADRILGGMLRTII
ncbi:hypothetical protein ACFSTD_08670 [Novosphingobium colocasiae]